MTDYGKTRSTVKPEAMVIDENSVLINTNITEFTDKVGEDQEMHGYEYNMTQYGKDEYIKIISEKNKELEQQMTDTQLALCDVYEMLA